MHSAGNQSIFITHINVSLKLEDLKEKKKTPNVTGNGFWRKHHSELCYWGRREKEGGQRVGQRLVACGVSEKTRLVGDGSTLEELSYSPESGWMWRPEPPHRLLFSGQNRSNISN